MVKKYLFELVKTMNRSEKRLFKLKAFTYNKADMNSKLFDVYVAAKDLDDLDKIMSKKIKSKRIIKLNSELYQLLQTFFAEEEMKSDKKYQLFQKVFTAQSFFKRNLFNQSYQIIEKVLKEAHYFELYEVALAAISIKQRISQFLPSFKAENRKELMNEFELINDRIYHTSIRFIAYDRLMGEFKLKGAARNKEEITYYESLIDGIDLEKKEGFWIRRNNLLIQSLFQTLSQDQDKLLESIRLLIELYDEYEHIAKLNIRGYIIMHFNYAKQLIRQNELTEAKNVLDKLGVMTQEYGDIAFSKIYYIGLLLEYSIRTIDIPQSFDLANKIVQMVDDEGNSPYVNYIWVKIIVAYLLSEEYQVALDAINSALESKIKTQRKDCYSLLLIYEIFIYAKLEWSEMAESKLLGLIRYMKLHYNKGGFENWCIGFLRKLIREDKSNYKAIIKNALEEINEISKEDLSEDILKVGEFKIWLEHELSS